MTPLAAIVSFRLGGADGVSVVAEHWGAALRRLGMAVRTVAGSGRADRLLPDLAMDATPGPGLPERLAEALAGAELVVVEAMKTEHRIAAGRAGMVRRVLVAEGQEVAAGVGVVELEEAPDG